MRRQGAGGRYLEGGLDFIIHHFDVGLVDGEATARKPRGLVDGNAAHLWAPLPVLLQYQQQLLPSFRKAFRVFLWEHKPLGFSYEKGLAETCRG